MKIVVADWLPYALPLKRSWRTSKGEIVQRRGRLLRLRSGDGRYGWGDSAPLPEFGIVDAAADAFAEESAHLDLVAKRAGRPLHQWLSGDTPVTELAVNSNLGCLSDDTPSLLERAAVQGFSVVKLKVGVSPVAEEIARLRQLASSSAQQISWRLDANGAWSLAEAKAFVSGCINLPIEGLEEPLATPDRPALGSLQSMAPWPIALDESIQLIDDGFFRHPFVRRLVIKPARHGGLLSSIELALRARSAGIETTVTSGLESACGLAACAQLAAAVAPESVHGLTTADWFASDTGTPYPVITGRMQLPTVAGLGFTPHDSFACASPSK
ncbi:enolase C-terminal domain-like protein [Dechloromonas sp. ARDL1]|uniref:enolase C-terminal domain-like protein n=1 Tax=Dechloromonas sp. ARDL1 TaxID=3322121 RepID=UPI003DA781CC